MSAADIVTGALLIGLLVVGVPLGTWLVVGDRKRAAREVARHAEIAATTGRALRGDANKAAFDAKGATR